MINFTWHQFSELTVHQLYAALALRCDVFVVEQCCPYLDVDGKDPLAYHLLGMENNTLVGYLRLFPPTQDQNYLVFGRIISARATRSKGYGKKLMEEMLARCEKHYPGFPIKCSAQHRLQKFYEGYGFKAYGEVYMEDDIPHIAMERKGSV